VLFLFPFGDCCIPASKRLTSERRASFFSSSFCRFRETFLLLDGAFFSQPPPSRVTDLRSQEEPSGHSGFFPFPLLANSPTPSGFSLLPLARRPTPLLERRARHGPRSLVLSGLFPACEPPAPLVSARTRRFPSEPLVACSMDACQNSSFLSTRWLLFFVGLLARSGRLVSLTRRIERLLALSFFHWSFDVTPPFKRRREMIPPFSNPIHRPSAWLPDPPFTRGFFLPTSPSRRKAPPSILPSGRAVPRHGGLLSEEELYCVSLRASFLRAFCYDFFHQVCERSERGFLSLAHLCYTHQFVWQ